jgi:leader peptidase (prepilin peptidase)/N-methyltransferase
MGNTLLVIYASLLGAIVGSFANVCIFRLPRQCMSIVKPRSSCPKCRSLIAWYDNIPVLSWVLLLGKCRRCSCSIPLRYPAVEILVAALFGLTAYVQVIRFPEIAIAQRLAVFGVDVYVLAALVIASFIDLKYRIIPEEITFSGIILAPVVSLAMPFLHRPLPFPQLPEGYERVSALMACVFGGLVGAGIVYWVGVIGKIIFRKDAMGMGDVKLMGMLGAFLGWKAIIFVFILGCIFGSVAGIISYLVTKDRYLAFGPWLALGAAVMLLFQAEMFDFAFHRYPEFIRSVMIAK